MKRTTCNKNLFKPVLTCLLLLLILPLVSCQATQQRRQGSWEVSSYQHVQRFEEQNYADKLFKATTVKANDEYIVFYAEDIPYMILKFYGEKDGPRDFGNQYFTADIILPDNKDVQYNVLGELRFTGTDQLSIEFSSFKALPKPELNEDGSLKEKDEALEALKDANAKSRNIIFIGQTLEVQLERLSEETPDLNISQIEKNFDEGILNALLGIDIGIEGEP